MKLILTVLMLYTAIQARAEVDTSADNDTKIFKIDGKVATARQAVQAAPNHTIERCNTVKGAESADGKDVVAYKCKTVVLSYSDRTGMPKWRVK